MPSDGLLDSFGSVVVATTESVDGFGIVICGVFAMIGIFGISCPPQIVDCGS
jgi:hypothetical protein